MKTPQLNQFIDRRSAIGKLAFSATFVSGLGLFNIFIPSRIVRLETVTGPVEIDLACTSRNLMTSAQAQYINYGGNIAYYNAMLAQQQMMAMQMAQARWQAYLAQQQQHYAWVNAQYQRAAMEAYSAFQTQYAQVSQLTVWPMPESVYARAIDETGAHGLVGLNANGDRVEVSRSLPALQAASWYSGTQLHSHLSPENRVSHQQYDTGPQSSDKLAKIRLPDNQLIDATGFKTTEGSIALSRDTFQTQQGPGRITKFKIGDDEEKYMVI